MSLPAARDGVRSAEWPYFGARLGLDRAAADDRGRWAGAQPPRPKPQIMPFGTGTQRRGTCAVLWSPASRAQLSTCKGPTQPGRHPEGGRPFEDRRGRGHRPRTRCQAQRGRCQNHRRAARGRRDTIWPRQAGRDGRDQRQAHLGVDQPLRSDAPGTESGWYSDLLEAAASILPRSWPIATQPT